MTNELDAETKGKDFMRVPLPPVSIHSLNGMSIQTDLLQTPTTTNSGTGVPTYL
jgi:hypothetical protein